MIFRIIYRFCEHKNLPIQYSLVLVLQLAHQNAGMRVSLFFLTPWSDETPSRRKASCNGQDYCAYNVAKHISIEHH